MPMNVFYDVKKFTETRLKHATAQYLDTGCLSKMYKQWFATRTFAHCVRYL